MKTVVNLLPERLQRRQLFRRRAIRWGAAWAVCLAAGPGTYFVRQASMRSLRGEVAAAEAGHAEIQSAVRTGDAIQAQIRKLKQRQRQLRSLPNGHVPLSILQLLGQSAGDTAGQLRLESMGAIEVPQTAAALTRVTVDLEGTAASDLAIGRFAASLRASGVFESVVLKSTRGAEVENRPVRRFRLQCVIVTGPASATGTA